MRGEFWAGMTVGLMLVPQGVATRLWPVCRWCRAFMPRCCRPLWRCLWAFDPLGRADGADQLADWHLAHWAGRAGQCPVGGVGGVDGVAVGRSATINGRGAFWLAAAVGDFAGAGRLYAGGGVADFGVAVACAHRLGRAARELARQPAVVALFDWGAAGFGLGSVAALVLAKRQWPQFPAVIVVMGGAGALSWALGYAEGGGKVIGALPAGLPHFYWPGALPWGTFWRADHAGVGDYAG